MTCNNQAAPSITIIHRIMVQETLEYQINQAKAILNPEIYHKFYKLFFDNYHDFICINISICEYNHL